MDLLDVQPLDKIIKFDNDIMHFFSLIYKEQQFGNVLLTNDKYDILFPLSYRGPNKGRFIWDVFEKYPETKGYIVEESLRYKEVTRVSFSSDAIERLLIKKGVLKLCPFRKRQVADETCRESSHYTEQFLPCYQEKCMLYNDGRCRYGS